MIRSIMFCNLCVGKFMWFLSPKLSMVSMKSIVSQMEIAFVGMLKSPIISKSPDDMMSFSRLSASSWENCSTFPSGGLYTTPRCSENDGDGNVKSAHSIILKLYVVLCFIFINSLWVTASPPPVLFFLGTDMDLYPWEHSLSCVRSSFTWIQVSVSAHMSMLFSIVYWISCVLFWTDLQLINTPLYMNEELFLIWVWCLIGSDHEMLWSIDLALVKLVDSNLVALMPMIAWMW